MPKQALKLFIVACYIIYCLTRLQNSPYFAYSSSLPNSQAEGLE